MKKLNSKGFTLIELLAVITILGILMLVAIPAVSRTIENSRRDTFANLGKTYISTIRNSVIADEFKCGSSDTSVSATPAGSYYFAIDSTAQATKDLMESGGKSSWGSNEVKGYVKWTKTAKTSGEAGYETTYSIVLVDQGNHGIKSEKEEKNVTRSAVEVDTRKSDPKVGYSAATGITAVSTAPAGATECTLK